MCSSTFRHPLTENRSSLSLNWPPRSQSTLSTLSVAPSARLAVARAQSFAYSVLEGSRQTEQVPSRGAVAAAGPKQTGSACSAAEAPAELLDMT